MHVLYELLAVLYLFSYRAAIFGSSDFNKLVDHVDGFSLMTYDYSSPGRYVANQVVLLVVFLPFPLLFHLIPT